MNITVIGLNSVGKQVLKKKLRRAQLSAYFANLTPCIIGIEGCASAHHWSRELTKLGHQVKLLPAQHVKAYVRGNKNDYNDALPLLRLPAYHKCGKWLSRPRRATKHPGPAPTTLPSGC